MITKNIIDENCQALQVFAEMSNSDNNVERKREGIVGVKTKLEAACPVVKDNEPYPEFGIMDYMRDYVSKHSFLHDIMDFVENHYADIRRYELLDEETKQKYYNKLLEYDRPGHITFTESRKNPDWIFMTYGPYRQFYYYQKSHAYVIAREMRGAFEECDEGAFQLLFSAYLLYSASLNELERIDKAIQRIGDLVEIYSDKSKVGPWPDPYEDVEPFQNVDSDEDIFYNFWGESLAELQDNYKEEKGPTGEQKACFLSHYNYRKLLIRFVNIFKSARADLVNEVPDAIREEIDDLLKMLLSDYIERIQVADGHSFEVRSKKLSSWKNRTINAAHDAEAIVPTIICYDSKSNGETSSTCILEHIQYQCEKIIDGSLECFAFDPVSRKANVPRYDFWGDDYEKLVEQYKGKRALPDNYRALFSQEDNSYRFQNEVRSFLYQAIDECSKNGGQINTVAMSETLEKVKVFYQTQFFIYNQRLDGIRLTDEEKKNASLGWLYFTKRDISDIRFEEEISRTGGQLNKSGVLFVFTNKASVEILDEMKRHILEDTVPETSEPSSMQSRRYIPNGNASLKLDRLYEFLHREDIRVISVSQADFEDAVYRADFNKLFDDARGLGSITKLKYVVSLLKNKFPKKWYDAVSKSSGIVKTQLTNINNDRVAFSKFKNSIDSIPLT